MNSVFCGKANVKREKIWIVIKLTLLRWNCCVLPFQLSTYHTKIETILAPILFSQDSLPTDFLENVVTSWYGSSQCNFCFASNNLASHIYIKSQFMGKYIYIYKGVLNPISIKKKKKKEEIQTCHGIKSKFQDNYSGRINNWFCFNLK